ncbi:MAG TPA: hypothetical protein VG226_01725 [Acidimicrobiales bacterium]|jgi:hypothetical protein|nr:hypothetical protein [Acidimicrobiales bacterium]
MGLTRRRRQLQVTRDGATYDVQQVGEHHWRCNPAPPADDGGPPEPRPATPGTTLPVDDGGTLRSGAGFVGTGKGRRDALRAGRKVEADHRRRLMEARKADLADTRAERTEHPYLPAAGELGGSSGRAHRRLRIRPHRATSEMLAGAYPFLAEEGLGAEGVLVGQDAWSGTAFCFDPWELYRRGVLTNPNLFLAGQIGRGKSTLAKALATRCIAFGRRVYDLATPKGNGTSSAGPSAARSSNSASAAVIASTPSTKVPALAGSATRCGEPS